MGPYTFHHSHKTFKELNIPQDKLLNSNILTWVQGNSNITVPTVNIQFTPPSTSEDISGLCWMNIPREPIKYFMHCSTFSTRSVKELEMGDLALCCISCRRSMTFGADWKAALSSFVSFDIYSCMAFCNDSSFADTDCTPVTWPEVCWEGVGVAPLNCPCLRSELLLLEEFVLIDIPFQRVNRKTFIIYPADTY